MALMFSSALATISPANAQDSDPLSSDPGQADSSEIPAGDGAFRSGRYIVESIPGEDGMSPTQIASLLASQLRVPEDAQAKGEIAGLTDSEHDPNPLALATSPGIRVLFDPSDGVPADVRVLTNWAAARWNDLLSPQGPVEIDFYWVSLGSSTLGAAGPNGYKQSSLLGTNAYIPAAILNHHATTDMFPFDSEGGMALNSSLYQRSGGWCTSLDTGQCPSNTFSMANTILHEMGHILGHGGSAREDTHGTTTFLSPPDLYDTHIMFSTTGGGGGLVPVVETAHPPTHLTTGELWMADSQASGAPVHRLHAPSPYEPGSSVGHWDESVYGEHLMTPYSFPAAASYGALPAEFKDWMNVLGWGDLRDGRSNPPALGDPCSSFPSNAVTGTSGGPFAAVVQSDSDAARIWRLYGVLFRRQPDVEGFEYWLGRYRSGTPIEQITDYFSTAPEVASVYSDGLRDEKYVQALYQNAFGRCPDDEGRSYWNTILAGQTMTRGQVLNNFSESSEFGTRTGVFLTNYGSGDIRS